MFGLAELRADGVLVRISIDRRKQIIFCQVQGGFGGGSRGIKLRRACATYFPGRVSHAVESIGPEPLRYFYTYACEKCRQKLDFDQSGQERLEGEVRNLNNAESLWAMQSDIGEFVWVEASKGYNVRARCLFDRKHRGAAEMKLGIAEIDSGIHYTLHWHLQAEIYKLCQKTPGF